MNQLLVPLAVGFLLEELAAADSATDWTSAKGRFASWLGTADPWLKAHPQIDAMIVKVVNPLIDAVAKAFTDVPDLKAAVVALAAKNSVAATAALLAIAKQAMPELAQLLVG